MTGAHEGYIAMFPSRFGSWLILGADYMGELSRLSELTRFAELTRFLYVLSIILTFRLHAKRVCPALPGPRL
jgi:hypothetical protein